MSFRRIAWRWSRPLGADAPRTTLPFKLIYHDGYDLNLGGHVFPAVKYRLMRERLLQEGLAAPGDFLTPEPATDGDLKLVHSAVWVDKVLSLSLGPLEILKLEIPLSMEMARGFQLATGGTILGARRALTDGLAFNIGGGFHHAYAGHGEGFCALNDVAVAIRRLQADGAIRRAMTVDVDVHHGNGTAAIFQGDPGVFTLSIHQFANYPADKPPSTVDIHLGDGTGDAEYLEKLGAALEPALDDFRPELIVYLAGADPYQYDRLGGLALTLDGLMARDRLMFRLARDRKIPVVVTLAGGYAEKTADTVTIHVNTLRAAREVMAGPTAS